MKDIIIKVNNDCMLHCPYCFAHNEKSSELSEDNINKLLEFCIKNKINNVKITGGEPFLFTYIWSFINRLTDFSDVMIFSNLMVKDCFLNIKHTEKIKVLVNINQSDFYTANQYDVLLNNIDYAMKNGINIVPGRTFYAAPYVMDDIIQLCIKYGMKTIRVSQANPTISKNNSWLNTEEIKSLLFSMRDLSESIKSLGIKIFFDCPIAPCIVGNELYSYFYSENMISLKCGSKLVINPDLSIEHCYITAPITSKRYFFEYPSYEVAIKHIDEQLMAYRKKIILDRCIKCIYRCDQIPCGCYGFMDVLKKVENDGK